MRTLTAALLLLLAAALAACGGTTESPLVGAGATTTRAGEAGGARDGRGGGAARVAAARDCTARGITVPPFNEGACVQDGQRFVVANGRSLLRLKTADVAIRSFTIVEALRRGKEVLTPQGVFLLIRLKVRNTSDEPQRFAAGQTLLTLEDQRLEEHTATEERFVPRALANRARAPIPPGIVVEGAVVYDVPLRDVTRVTRDGQLLVANLGGVRGPGGREIGLFRIGVG